jgi:broad specificity phosphatase PhoE
MQVSERARRINEPFPGGGQRYQQVVTETVGFLQFLAEGWDEERVLVIGHTANKWALDVLLTGALLEGLVNAPFGWREG